MAIKKTVKKNVKSGVNKAKNMDKKTAAGVGAGVLAAAAAAAAGYYFYGDKNAKKHRRAASKWAKDMKTDVMKEAKSLKQLDQKALARIVDRAAAVYQGVRSVDREDLRAAANELKRNWREVRREVTEVTASAKKAPAKKSAKRAPAKKTVAKKSAKKTS